MDLVEYCGGCRKDGGCCYDGVQEYKLAAHLRDPKLGCAFSIHAPTERVETKKRINPLKASRRKRRGR